MDTPKQKIMKYMLDFGKLYQLPHPPVDYIETLYAILHENKWRFSELEAVLRNLLHDDKYAEVARFGKYPTYYDLNRVKKQIKSKDFYDALTSYLSGCFWEKENILKYASPAQKNAIMQAGGLENLYQRATGDMATPVYKLIDIISQNESDTPLETIDTNHRIGVPQTLKQITKNLQGEKNERNMGL